MTPKSANWLLWLVFVSSSALALESDRQKPMDVQADQLQGNVNQGVSTLLGHVKITQGTLIAQADQATLHQDARHKIVRAVLTGSPASLVQQLDEGGQLDIRAREIDYDQERSTATLTGDATVKQPRGEVSGQRLVYDLRSKQITGSGDGAGGRVSLRLYPQAAGQKEPTTPDSRKTP